MEQPRNWKGRAVLFLTSQCVTLFGSTLVQMAIVWYVTLTTSSGAWIAALTVCAYLPQFLISFVAGVWADRYSKKALIIGADAAIAGVTLVLALLFHRLEGIPALMPAILAVSVLRSLGAGIQTPAVNAMLPQLVPEEQLMRFNGINATMQSLVQFAAPAAAGVILSAGSLGSALWIDIATAAVGIGVLGALCIPRQAASMEKADLLGDLKTGVGYAFHEPLVGRLLTVYGLFIFLSVPAGFLAQLLVSRLYGSTYWYLTAVELTGFAGMTAGGLLMGVWGGFRSRIKTLLLGLGVFGALGAAMGLIRNFPIYLVLMVIYGVALTVVQTAATTALQENTRPEMLGRVFGLMGSMYAGFLPIGMAVFGPMADAVPLPFIMVGAGAALLLITWIMAMDRKFRDGKAVQQPEQE